MAVDVDLHLHTLASDGRLTPTELVRLAAGQGLKCVAITDHDTTEGLAEAYEAAGAFPDLTIISGIELSADIPGDEVHVLGYYLDYGDPDFQAQLRQFRIGRVDRARLMVEKLDALGVHLEWERVQAMAGDGAVGRPTSRWPWWRPVTATSPRRPSRNTWGATAWPTWNGRS